jgi:GNAT superfamily N-acetyltransferase
MKDPCNIRDAMLDDLPAMRRIRLSVVENPITEEGLLSLGITPESTTELLRTVGKAWVADCAGEAVGFSISNRETAAVWAVFVLPEHEGRGFGSRLLRRASDWLFEQGLEEIWLSTNPDPSVRAHGFYRNLGWMPDGVEPNGEVRYVLRREKS